MENGFAVEVMPASDAADAELDAFFEACPTSFAQQTPGWRDVITTAGDDEPAFLACRRRGRLGPTPTDGRSPEASAQKAAIGCVTRGASPAPAGRQSGGAAARVARRDRRRVAAAVADAAGRSVLRGTR